MALVEVVKYDGGPDVFAWKFPGDELGTLTQLIVNESQEAIFFKGGQALDVLGPGRHTLSTANIPLLRALVNLPFGGNSPFKAEVWYVNKIHSLDIRWGTPSPIQLQDPKYKIFVQLRSFGQFGIQIAESKKFLTKLVGTMKAFDKTNVSNYFRGLYLTKVKDSLSAYLVKQSVSVLEMNAYLDELSNYLKERIMPTMDEYGISLLNFYVNDISIPEDDPGVIKLKDALAKKAEMDIVGYSYVQQRSFDTLEGAATNPGAVQSGVMGAGIGMGMGFGMSGAIGNQVNRLGNNINVNPVKKCPGCNADMDVSARFCSACGYDTQKTDNQVKTKEETKEEANAGDTTLCSECNCEYSKKHKFCPECGKPNHPCVFCGADMKVGSVNCPVCGKAAPKKCPKCGAMVNEKLKFCPECGEPLIKKCPKCGTQVKDKQKFCFECGTNLTNGSNKNEE